jgi:hypothetical protein
VDVLGKLVVLPFRAAQRRVNEPVPTVSAIGRSLKWLTGLLALIFAGAPSVLGDVPLPVHVEVGPGPFYVGQGFELRAGVVASGRRPKIDPPPFDGALIWTIGTELKPISATGIGSIVNSENLFVTRFRVVARRAGTLVVPSMVARTEDRSGRSQPLRVPIQSVPALDRPAEFLGGVGRFELHADADPKVLRAGQELKFRIRVAGPAAWGMTARPELKQNRWLALGSRVEPEPDETTAEPPERTFVYRLRPARAGDAVLPPVAIAAFDPEIKRYVTHVTTSVPIRVVAVPAFDPATIGGDEPVRGVGRAVKIAWGLSAVVLLASAALLMRVRRRLRSERPQGPAAARRYAARLGRGLESLAARAGPGGRDAAKGTLEAAELPGEPAHDAALRVREALIRYLELGIGRPAGALTPDEARRGVTGMTDSEELGRHAADLAARCDRALYRGADGEPSARGLLKSAGVLFQSLGRVGSSRRRAR